MRCATTTTAIFPLRLVTVALPLLLLQLLLLTARTDAEFSADFAHWLKEHYGEDVRNALERLDLGTKGSFGGRQSPGDPLQRQPVVFVHGVSDTAGERMTRARNWFKQHAGYSDAELYGTTYANGAQGNPLQWAQYSMKCDYVKAVRALIVAVRLYTGRAVDVVAFSLGVPVSRKAILGGQCVDTGEQLGSSLTKFIDSFVGVAGPNHGISLQVGGISIPGCVFALIPVCNPTTGLYSGVCPAESIYLQDINRQIGYEAQNVFSIYSRQDQIVGYTVCNQITSFIPGSRGAKEIEGLNHDQTFHQTHAIQLAMLQDHIVI